MILQTSLGFQDPKPNWSSDAIQIAMPVISHEDADILTRETFGKPGKPLLSRASFPSVIFSWVYIMVECEAGPGVCATIERTSPPQTVVFLLVSLEIQPQKELPPTHRALFSFPC